MNAERWRQIEELYHAARERGPEEREALLTRLRPIVGNTANYDLAPDGTRLAALLAPEEAPTRLTFLLNFFDELRRRAPVGK
jgi:hypothetical protein